ncbi:MAG: eukaryotic-like serine/threonine-protein kinase [Thermoleophilaceae bacterium]|nr:eukaryotic-like serine/threonine-protein kinase [Thermoleophilaceae bacterium]
MERPLTTDDSRTAPLDDDRPRGWSLDAPATERLDDPERTERLRGEPAARAAPRSRVVLDRYRLERRLGAGGFGVVWLAFDEKLEREVAVKVIVRDGDEPIPVRAEREARVAARLNHPGIVGLYELAADDDAVYLVSELVPGRTLAELMNAGALSDLDVARIGGALCDALGHAHGRKVIHRDVKPQNVIVVAEPAAGAGFAKLADFGVAHLASGDPLTRTGDVVGTLAYMAPEQAAGERVGYEVDVYSLALTLYEAWSGRNPVRANGPVATARRLGTVLPPLGGRRRDLPPELCRTIDAALDPDPERRPTLKTLGRALREAEDELSDHGGLVEPGTLERFGLGRRERAPMTLPGGRLARVLIRLGAGAAAGVLLAVAIHTLGPKPPVSAAAVGLVAAACVALLPRAGWVAAALALVVWLGTDAGLPGTALVVAVAVAAVPLLVPRAGWLWSLPVLAPLLGAIGLAPLYVALAGLAGTAWRRAGLAAAGALWLVIAEVVADERLLYGAPRSAEPRAAWDDSLLAAGKHALAPLVTTPALLPLASFALLAALLPLFLRGRVPVLDLLGASLWAAGLVLALQASGRLMEGEAATADPRGLVVGALLAALVAAGAAAAGLVRPPFGSDPVP